MKAVTGVSSSGSETFFIWLAHRKSHIYHWRLNNGIDSVASCTVNQPTTTHALNNVLSNFYKDF